MKKIFIITLLLNSYISNAKISYVTPEGSGNYTGSSWKNAAPGENLQQIINQSVDGDQIWVSHGLYKTTSSKDRSISFKMKNGVAIIGGFKGNENLISERNLQCDFYSILSGEIGDNGKDDNSYKVISNSTGLDSTSVLDGFIIQDGNDDRSPTINEGLGGGIYNDGGYNGNFCNPKFIHCIIQNNFAQYGAGVFNSGHSGGTSSPIFINCIITNNSAYISGGGMDNFGLAGNSSPMILNTLFISNSATFRAGGMYCWAGNNGETSPKIINSVFIANTAEDGGGIVTDNENSPAGSNSGISAPSFLNSILWDNLASKVGPQFYRIGEGIINASNSAINLENQNLPHTITGENLNNIHVNPNFVSIENPIGNDGCWRTDDDGLKLNENSPLINMGLVTDLLKNDILNSSYQGKPDIGAYEYQSKAQVKIKENSYFTIQYTLDNNIQILNTTNHEQIIQLFDNMGRLISTLKMDKMVYLNTQNFEKGMYIIKNNNNQTNTIIIY